MIFMGNLDDATNTTNMKKVNSCYNITNINQKHSHNKLRDQQNKKKLTILHQNIRGIKKKVDEFLVSLSPNVPQIICPSDHLRNDEISKVNFSQYTVGTFFCRQTYSHGGVCSGS
jgi:hypothetical protein